MRSRHVCRQRMIFSLLGHSNLICQFLNFDFVMNIFFNPPYLVGSFDSFSFILRNPKVVQTARRVVIMRTLTVFLILRCQQVDIPHVVMRINWFVVSDFTFFKTLSEKLTYAFPDVLVLDLGQILFLIGEICKQVGLLFLVWHFRHSAWLRFVVQSDWILSVFNVIVCLFLSVSQVHVYSGGVVRT